jgi:sulfur-carrier protein
MTISVMIFGQLTDIVSKQTLILNDIADTNHLVNELNKQYPALAQAKFIIAVDKQTVTSNTKLRDGSMVALLPPFSGG